MKKIKILHITTSLKTGGAEKLLCDLIKHMDPQFEHHVAYFYDGPHIQTLKDMKVPLHHIQGGVSLYDPIFFARLFSIVKKINPDLIHTQLWAANNAGRVAAKLFGKPVVSVLHNYMDQDGRIRNLIDRCTVQFADKLIAYSDGIAHSLLERDSWIPAAKISLLDIGIDKIQLHQQAAAHIVERRFLNLNENHFVIGSVGRFVPVRRYDLMIDAFDIVQKKYSHARLLLVGVGELEESLRSKALHMRIHDKITFIVGQPGYKYYQLFDCFSLTTDKEGPSLALLEAMSFGLPCVRTNVELHHPVIEHEVNGLIAQAGDAYELAEGFIRIMENPAFAQQLGKNALKTVEEKFDVRKSAHAFEKVLQSVMKI